MYAILHVETSNVYRTLIKKICNELDVLYNSAAAMDEVFDCLTSKNINLIITAMELEDSNSETLIHHINESQFKNIPIVVITGNDTDEDRKKMFDLGIVDYISKKSSPEEIKYSLLNYKKEDDILKKMRDLRFAVCDDSSMDRYIIERIFHMGNIHNVDFYETGEALLASTKKYDVFIIDLVLKHMSGRNVILKLREGGSESVIIVISGIDHYKTISNILTIGADDYLSKPFNNELFLARLKTNVRNYLLLKEVELKTDMLQQMAITDGLSGLYNHKHVFDTLEIEIRKAERHKANLSVIMMDIDHFKKINDSYGHPFGDQIIVKIANIIKRELRDIDIIGRYGGEEFLLVLPGTRLEQAVTAAERIRTAVEQIRTNKAEFRVTISGGVQEYSGQTVKQIIKEADYLLYSAKHGGRNRMESNISLNIAKT